MTQEKKTIKKKKKAHVRQKPIRGLMETENLAIFIEMYRYTHTQTNTRESVQNKPLIEYFSR